MSRQANGVPSTENGHTNGGNVIGGPGNSVGRGLHRRPNSVAGGRYSSQPQLCSSTEQLDIFADTGIFINLYIFKVINGYITFMLKPKFLWIFFLL